MEDIGLPSTLAERPLHAYKILCDAFLSVSTAEYGQALADAVSATILNAQAAYLGLPITGPRGSPSRCCLRLSEPS